MQIDNRVYVNGIDALTGEYLIKPMSSRSIEALIKSVETEVSSQLQSQNEKLLWLRRIWRHLREPSLGFPPNVDPTDVRQVGWGIVFHEKEEQSIRDALRP